MAYDLVREGTDQGQPKVERSEFAPATPASRVAAEGQVPASSRIPHYLAVAVFLITIGAALGVEISVHPPDTDIPFLGLLPAILRGLSTTITLTVLGAALALVVALVVGIARTVRLRAVSALSGFYVEFFRGTSVLVQMFWIFYVLPSPPFNARLTAMQAGVLALGLNLGAYGAEVVRGALQAVPKEQIEASVALNMSPGLRLRHIILPQAMVRILPPFGNLLIELLKATSLVSLITLADVTFQGRLLIQAVGRMSEVFLILLVVYFLLAYPLVLGVRWLERQRRWV